MAKKSPAKPPDVEAAGRRRGAAKAGCCETIRAVRARREALNSVLTKLIARQGGTAAVRRAASACVGRLVGQCAAVLTAILMFWGVAAGDALAQGVVKGQYGDWQMRCDTPPGAKSEQCALIQNVTADDRPNVGLSVIVLRTADKKQRILRVLAPLGVLLPSGLGLKIDAADVGRTPFVRCLPNGCVAEAVLDDKLLDQLKTGKNATFIVFQTPEEGIGIPIALAGFGEGFEKLP